MLHKPLKNHSQYDFLLLDSVSISTELVRFGESLQP